MFSISKGVVTAVTLANIASYISLVSAKSTDGTLRSRAPTTCPGVPDPSFPFEVASGWTATKVAGNLSYPRGIVVDKEGRLLLVEDGLGITQHTLTDEGCIESSRLLIASDGINTFGINHGIYLSLDGNTLYASGQTTAWRFSYNATGGDIYGDTNGTVLVDGMNPTGHATRTLIIPPHAPNLLVVSHGSDDNIDLGSIDPASSRAVVKVFDLSKVPDGGYNYVRDGYLMGYGLRNEVALAFDGNNMLWGVENSADDFNRTVDGVETDIHQDNPAEELNYLGDVTVPNNNWYGYPMCSTVWDPSLIPDTVFAPGDQFVAAPNSTFNDTTCIQKSQPARMIFQDHNAPIDSKFDATFSTLFITLHGSWNRQPAAGFKLVKVPFTKDSSGAYTPVAAANSTSGYDDILYQADSSNCSDSTCIRPSALTFVAGGDLYMGSDNSVEGELFLVRKV